MLVGEDDHECLDERVTQMAINLLLVVWIDVFYFLCLFAHPKLIFLIIFELDGFLRDSDLIALFTAKHGNLTARALVRTVSHFR